MRKYIIVIFVLLTCYPCILTAQSQSEFTASLGLGSAALKYKLDNGQSKLGFGWGLGAGYSYYFSRMIGISLGLEAEAFGSSVDMGNLSSKQQIPTPAGLSGNFSLQANYTGLKETQSAVMLQIPVMLQFQFPVDKKDAIYFGAGVKAGFPVSSKWNQSAASLTTTGYSDYTAQQYVDMPNHGFSTYPNVGASGKLDLTSPVFLALEGGLKFGIGAKNYLYAGIFLDYGLSNIYKAPTTNSNLPEYNSASPADYSNNSILTTSHYSASSEVKPFAVGLKIKLGIGMGKEFKSNEPVKKVKQVKPEKPVRPVNQPVEKKTVSDKPKKTEQKIVPVGD